MQLVRPFFSGILFSLLLFVCSLSTQAQSYNTAFGVRVGSGSGVNVKSFFSRSAAVEGILLYRRGGLRTILLLEQHLNLGRHSHTALYFGAGGHYGYNGILIEDRFNKMVAGVDMVVGFEYTFPHSPVVFGVELKPMVELLEENPTFSGNNGGVFLRFVLD